MEDNSSKDRSNHIGGGMAMFLSIVSLVGGLLGGYSLGFLDERSSNTKRTKDDFVELRVRYMGEQTGKLVEVSSRLNGRYLSYSDVLSENNETCFSSDSLLVDKIKDFTTNGLEDFEVNVKRSADSQGYVVKYSPKK